MKSIAKVNVDCCFSVLNFLFLLKGTAWWRKPKANYAYYSVKWDESSLWNICECTCVNKSIFWDACTLQLEICILVETCILILKWISLFLAFATQHCWKRFQKLYDWELHVYHHFWSIFLCIERSIVTVSPVQSCPHALKARTSVSVFGEKSI